MADKKHNDSKHPINDGEGVTELSLEVENELIAAGTFEDRKFSLLSVIGIGYSITNTAVAILASMATGIGSGGPVLFIWGQIGIFLIALCMACTLAEFASAMPNAAGQFYWVGKLAPKSIVGGVSYVTGLMAWASSVCIVASGTLLTPLMVIGMYILRHPNFVYKPWMGFVGFQVTNIFVFFFNTFERFLPIFSKASMLFSATSVLIIFITILAASPTYQSADFVFTDFVNLSGWNDGIAALTGIIGINWGYSCLDACTHLAEEVPDPRRTIPKALIATVVVGILTGLPISLAFLFCIGDINEIFATPTYVPSLQLFVQVFNGRTAGAIGLQSLIFITFLGSIFGAHTWQARLCWTFARQNGLPFSDRLGQIAPNPFGVPLWAHGFSCCCVAVLGFVYLGSTTAFNAFVGSGLLLQYMTYSVCVVGLFWRGRSNFAHGPFWLRRMGPVCNAVTLIWTVYSLVFYSFPPYLPVTESTMNYVSVVIVAITVLATLNWFMFARKRFVCLT